METTAETVTTIPLGAEGRGSGVSMTSGLRNSLVGSVADFEVHRSTVMYGGEVVISWPQRDVISKVEEDGLTPLAIVSDRYSLVSNRDCFTMIEAAILGAGVSTVRCGVHVVGDGAKFRAIYLLPECYYDVSPGDRICMAIQVLGSYDGTTRLIVKVGAYRMVCANGQVGGGGILGGGFRAKHAGDLQKDVEQAIPMIKTIIEEFPQKAAIFGEWNSAPFDQDAFSYVTEIMTEQAGMKRHVETLAERWEPGDSIEDGSSLWDAYNVGTQYATHDCRSIPVAYRVGESITGVFVGYWQDQIHEQVWN